MKMVTVSVVPVTAKQDERITQEERRIIKAIKGIHEVSKVKYLGYQWSVSGKYSFTLSFCGVSGWSVDVIQSASPSRNNSKHPRYVISVKYAGKDQMDDLLSEMRIVLKEAIREEVNH